MIMMWSGTFEELRDNLPYWRLCAPPDAGTNPNNVTVPNLVDTFIISSGYTDNTDEQTRNNNRRQPVDNAGRNFGSAINLVVGSTGGTNSLNLTLTQMPVHNHEVEINVSSPGSFSISGTGGLQLVYQGGNLTNKLPVTAKARCLNGGVTCTDRTSCSNKNRYACGSIPNCDATASGSCTPVKTFHNDGFSVRSGDLSNNPFTFGTLSLEDQPIERTSFNESLKGNDINHENRPDFYTLAYIVYVGVPR
jgi:hypothetical protein